MGNSDTKWIPKDPKNACIGFLGLIIFGMAIAILILALTRGSGDTKVINTQGCNGGQGQEEQGGQASQVGQGGQAPEQTQIK